MRSAKEKGDIIIRHCEKRTAQFSHETVGKAIVRRRLKYVSVKYILNMPELIFMENAFSLMLLRIAEVDWLNNFHCIPILLKFRTR
jgi:hypothetical protein